MLGSWLGLWLGLGLTRAQFLLTLNVAGFLHAGARSRQQLAYVLLRNITLVGPLPVLYVQQESLLHITGPTRALLAQKADDVLNDHLFLEDTPIEDLRPHTYRFEKSRQQLFDSRRRVCFQHHYLTSCWRGSPVIIPKIDLHLTVPGHGGPGRSPLWGRRRSSHGP